MSKEVSSIHRRRVVATMTRGKSKEVIMVRHYSYFDTAMPRMLQLAISYCNEGDFIEFASTEIGHQLGVLHIRKGGRFEMEMSPLVKSSPSLLKLMNEDQNWKSPLVSAAMNKSSKGHGRSGSLH
jgi:hypothetical protein